MDIKPLSLLTRKRIASITDQMYEKGLHGTKDHQLLAAIEIAMIETNRPDLGNLLSGLERTLKNKNVIDGTDFCAIDSVFKMPILEMTKVNLGRIRESIKKSPLIDEYKYDPLLEAIFNLEGAVEELNHSTVNRIAQFISLFPFRLSGLPSLRIGKSIKDVVIYAEELVKEWEKKFK
jgi:hypothetical protein